MNISELTLQMNEHYKWMNTSELTLQMNEH